LLALTADLFYPFSVRTRLPTALLMVQLPAAAPKKGIVAQGTGARGNRGGVCIYRRTPPRPQRI
jgi:hypothetical protein